MAIYIVAKGEIICDTCKKKLGILKYDKKDGDFLEERVEVTCNKCIKVRKKNE